MTSVQQTKSTSLLSLKEASRCVKRSENSILVWIQTEQVSGRKSETRGWVCDEEELRRFAWKLRRLGRLAPTLDEMKMKYIADVRTKQKLAHFESVLSESERERVSLDIRLSKLERDEKEHVQLLKSIADNLRNVVESLVVSTLGKKAPADDSISI